jgi:hypothetical protein
MKAKFALQSKGMYKTGPAPKGKRWIGISSVGFGHGK